MPLEQSPNSTGAPFSCPRCGEDLDEIYNVDSWLCAKCGGVIRTAKRDWRVRG